MSGVRRKTGLDVQIRDTAVQHHEDWKIVRLGLERYAATSVPTRLHRRTRGQHLLTAAAHARHAFEVAPFSSPPFFAKGRPEDLWISMTHHQHGSRRRVSRRTTVCQKRPTSSFMPLSLHGRSLLIEDIELLLHACDPEEKIAEPQMKRCTTSRCVHCAPTTRSCRQQWPPLVVELGVRGVSHALCVRRGPRSEYYHGSNLVLLKRRDKLVQTPKVRYGTSPIGPRPPAPQRWPHRPALWSKRVDRVRW